MNQTYFFFFFFFFFETIKKIIVIIPVPVSSVTKSASKIGLGLGSK